MVLLTQEEGCVYGKGGGSRRSEEWRGVGWSTTIHLRLCRSTQYDVRHARTL